MTITRNDSPGGPMTSRRRFILGGSALLGGALLFRGEFAAGHSGLAAMASSGGPRLGVGYVEGSAGAPSLAALLAAGGGRVVPARSLGEGDLRDVAAAITVHGFGPGVTCDGGCRFERVLVDAHMASPDPASAHATVPYYAWTYRRAPAMLAQPSRFVVGAASGHRVGFSVDAASTPSAAAPASTVFTSAGRAAESLPTLQRGIYLLGLDQGAWESRTSLPDGDDPAWSGLASIVVSVDAA